MTCGEPTAMHCSNPDCHWSVCPKQSCGWIYSGAGVIPTWERYVRGRQG